MRARFVGLTGLLAAAALAAAAGCGSGSGSGSGARFGPGVGGGSTGGTTGGGPAVGKPAQPTLYALITVDGSGVQPAAESISIARFDAAGALAPLGQPMPTNGTGHRNTSGSGFAASPDGRFLFVGHNVSHTIEAFPLKTDGSLAAASGTPVALGGAVQSIAVHPHVNRVYASVYDGASSNKIHALSYDATTGALTLVHTATVANDVREIAVDPAGTLLAAAHMFGTPGFSICALDAQGNILTPAAVTRTIAGAGRPKGVAFDRTGSFLYVRDLDRGIYAFQVSASAVTALNSGNPYSAGGFHTDSAVSATSDLVFLLSRSGANVDIQPYLIQSNGTLLTLAKVTVQDDIQNVIATRNGFVLASSRTAPRVHSFSVNPMNLQLVPNPVNRFAIPAPTGVTGPLVVVE